MKYKYLMITGLAFCEQGDMDRLSSYARKGWILDSIKGCFLYRLKKSEPQDLVYSVDYRYDADDEYFSLFKEAGWKHILTSEKSIHIFSAKKGTEPIYSDSDSEISKYESIMEKLKKGTIISAVFSLLTTAATIVSAFYMKKLFIISSILLTICLIIFGVNLLPYFAFSSRIKQIKKYGKCITDDMATRKFYLVNMIGGLLLLVMAVSEIAEKRNIWIITVIIALINISIGCKFFTSKKKAEE